MFKDWCWEDTWMTLLVILAISAASLIATICLETKNVDYYYVSTASSTAPVICVYAHWTWHGDERAYCSDDKDRILDFLTRANATLPTRAK